ncbi:hypothetical protein A2803_00250 [Candidatus Woesebacteria bacterium RIFCSPHIGHO2_01_FULL_44_21]|uniref:SpoVT-AbrB domain-containing protein n=1 Tax=Candidatus Woesebacteria bacterium RIFCSPHIGHO2_01_FULL_44_21 TaxID=1802503 RepID=A0A1F7Z0P6_9BACT|nr:MAG: hypothetical protein A2803_00250 [Candidatus Woesebacteria bacterium RIFCSPHIGHO2_01_FULL_44_21]OGM70583.1 MAG: hypothetical protein A2897_02145 [Candidatus Woesebacteria bacterium RIFCSPLOWO2_01_FULL_44_24b]
MTTIVSVTSKRQITLPKDLMDILGVEKGDRLIAKKRGKKVLLEPAGRGILEFAGKFGTFKIPKGKTLEDLIGEATVVATKDVLR